jgi:DNA-binding NtrC family response regulator
MAQARSSFLIVSTDSATAEALGAILFDAGFAGRRVSSDSAALTELDRGAYDVVIADHVLGDSSAAGLTESLVERGIEVPVVVLVRVDSPADGVAAVRAGAVDFLRMPLLQARRARTARRRRLEEGLGVRRSS